MKKLLHELWTKPFGEYEDKNIRLLALISSFIIHIAGITILWFFVRSYVPTYSTVPTTKEDKFGSSGGGGGRTTKEVPIEFGASSGDDEDPDDTRKFTPEKVNVIRLHIVSPESQINPIIAEVKEKKKKDKKKPTHPGASLVKESTIHHPRNGMGPGQDGGMGGGRGGGIGKGVGSSIDWGGNGDRNLLSGTRPVYPSGTDKQMAVTLQFMVLPDGSVSQVIPVTKGDELLERAAISALETWRFERLPSDKEQKTQRGKITFNFKFERSAGRPIND